MRPVRRLPSWLALLLCAAVVAPAAVRADAPAVSDCTVHLRLTHHYTVQQLQQAISTMSASVKEYTDCSDVLQRALSDELSGRSVGGGAGGSGGSFLPLPLLVALIVVLLVGAGYGVAAARRRRGTAEGAAEPPPPPPEEPETRPLA